jgi:hypothetical protein
MMDIGFRIAPGPGPVSSFRDYGGADVERRDDDVVAGEQGIRVVEPAVGPDLELAAVEEAEALGRRLGRGGAVGLRPVRTGH